MNFTIDDTIPEWHQDILKQEAVEALAMYKEMTKKKKIARLECAIGRENRDVMGRWIVVRWHISKPKEMTIGYYNPA